MTPSRHDADDGRVMVERDKDGRPKATRNAGAFLGPFGGMVPVPSEVLERHWRRRKRRSRFSNWTLFTIAVVIVIVLFFLIVVALTPGTTAMVSL